MNIKRFGATVAVAIGVSLPLAACGSSPAPSVTTVTATTPTYPTYSSPCPLGDGFDRCIDTRRAERQAADAARPSARPSSNPAQSKHDGGGLPWWAWMVIVPAGLVAALVLGFKVMEWNDEQRVRRAEARVAELDAREARRASRVHDYPDDYEDDEDDELDEDDMAFLHRATDPAPSAPAAPVQPAAGNLLSSLRQQGGAQ
ncbi:Uncharacterised protein [Mycobacteroides abscessus subsp. massiliense]|uniref:hypothetical protein n=1 Tax=Mycobacteroides abscessus TaxID=36809 RepID=UPI0009A68456|nr:hypothetical protein [Mycobacteroides abscessus]SLI41324.1 Uncharacterised protein [Mycobacteroides abscessus subsp. massiliense]